MHKLLISLPFLALLGCASHQPAKPIFPQQQNQNDPLTFVSYNDNLEWTCQQEQATYSALYVKCQVHNYNETGDHSTCLSAHYLTGVSLENISQSETKCTPMIAEHQTINFYLTITKHRPRKEARVICGLDSSFCRLKIVEEKNQ